MQVQVEFDDAVQKTLFNQDLGGNCPPTLSVRTLMCPTRIWRKVEDPKCQTKTYLVDRKINKINIAKEIKPPGSYTRIS